MNNPKAISPIEQVFLEEAFRADDTLGTTEIPHDKLLQLKAMFCLEADVAVLYACTASDRVQNIRGELDMLPRQIDGGKV